MPFGIHRVPDGQGRRKDRDYQRRVSIAFRHSPRSRLHLLAEGNGIRAWSPLPFGIHRVPDSWVYDAVRLYYRASPLPFGIHRVPDAEAATEAATASLLVSIAFRHSPRSRPERKTDMRIQYREVSIAFRHSPRSRQNRRTPNRRQINACVSIAFRHSPRSRPGYVVPGGGFGRGQSPLPFGIHRVPGEMLET
ncbi:hypothetical protein SBV1_2840002 [Verrucomicrobia bacterium]|nr:hypothetical protein SBV1_2840002 [Verrucomicrobiota bacterium]